MTKGQKLYYCGEDEVGCTADDDFFVLLQKKVKLNEKLTHQLQENELQWQTIHEHLNVYDGL